MNMWVSWRWAVGSGGGQWRWAVEILLFASLRAPYKLAFAESLPRRAACGAVGKRVGIFGDCDRIEASLEHRVDHPPEDRSLPFHELGPTLGSLKVATGGRFFGAPERLEFVIVSGSHVRSF
jgi:hypothetical protein